MGNLPMAVLDIVSMSSRLPFQFALPSAEFNLRFAPAPDGWRIIATGLLEAMDSAAKVQPELLRLHAAAVEAKIPVVRLDVADVEYMNSSALKAFMAWFLTASNEKAHKYRIEVTIDPARSWQKLSF